MDPLVHCCCSLNNEIMENRNKKPAASRIIKVTIRESSRYIGLIRMSGTMLTGTMKEAGYGSEKMSEMRQDKFSFFCSLCWVWYKTGYRIQKGDKTIVYIKIALIPGVSLTLIILSQSRWCSILSRSAGPFPQLFRQNPKYPLLNIPRKVR